MITGGGVISSRPVGAKTVRKTLLDELTARYARLQEELIPLDERRKEIHLQFNEMLPAIWALESAEKASASTFDDGEETRKAHSLPPGATWTDQPSPTDPLIAKPIESKSPEELQKEYAWELGFLAASELRPLDESKSALWQQGWHDYHREEADHTQSLPASTVSAWTEAANAEMALDDFGEAMKAETFAVQIPVIPRAEIPPHIIGTEHDLGDFVVIEGQTYKVVEGALDRFMKLGGVVKWDGGECPVERGDEFAVLHRSGRIVNWDKYCLPFLKSNWLHDGTASDIIAYRITSQLVEKENGQDSVSERGGYAPVEGEQKP